MDKPKEMLGKAMIGAAATQKPLVVVGSVNADVCVGVNRLPKPGETLSGRSLEYFPGGKASAPYRAVVFLHCTLLFTLHLQNDCHCVLHLLQQEAR